MAPDNQGICYKDSQILYKYLFDRKCSMSGGLGNYSYDTTPILQIVRKLNSTLPNYCIELGLAPAYIVDACDVGNGRIMFTLGGYNNGF